MTSDGQNWIPEGKDWIDALEAIATPSIAIVALVFAAMTYFLERKRRRDELFDRRFDFYLRFRDFWMPIGGWVAEDNDGVAWNVDMLNDEARAKIILFAEEAGFLFDGKMRDFIISLPRQPREAPRAEMEREILDRFRPFMELT